MNSVEILHHFIDPNEALYQVVYLHSRAVADFALRLADRHPQWPIDRSLLEDAALLHDVGVVRVDAPSIHCFGSEPYIRHGVLGAAMLRELASDVAAHLEDDAAARLDGDATRLVSRLEACARVCERHTGTGLTIRAIEEGGLPLPKQDLSPQTLEEELICFADKFFSKTHLDQERTPQQARAKLEKFGRESLDRFDNWCERFL